VVAGQQGTVAIRLLDASGRPTAADADMKLHVDAVAQIYAHRQTVEVGPKLSSRMFFSGAPCCHLFGSSFSFSFPTSSASTSFVSRCTGPRDFARFVVGSLFFPELLCFFKVDLLSRFDCTLECVDHW
jgi:hypothetical protein